MTTASNFSSGPSIFAKEPKMTAVDYPSVEQQERYRTQAVIAGLFFVGLLFVSAAVS